ncbi:MAG: endolytic transglycosylase MltG [Syntrophales bacterium]
MLRSVKRYNILLTVMILMVSVFSWLSFRYYAAAPLDNQNKTSMVNIPRGTGFFEVADILYKAGMIKDRPFFYLLAVLKNAPKCIKAGEYEFLSSMSPTEIIDKLVRGDVKKSGVLIPEDLTLREIVARLVSKGLVNGDEFMVLAGDPSFLDTLGIEGPSVEGYLYPDTYWFTQTMGARKIIEIMVNQFWKKLTPEMISRAEKLGLTVSEFVTFASIVGKESGSKEEKSLISAVFHNRLKRNMKLQSDPTAVYNCGNFNGNITRADLRRDTPYNTYRIDGLPPSPIANPGFDSLYAVVYPANVDYLYFVSQNDGSHHFSSSLSAHNRAVLEYRNKMKKK